MRSADLRRRRWRRPPCSRAGCGGAGAGPARRPSAAAPRSSRPTRSRSSRVDTDVSSGQWQAVDALLAEVPAHDALLTKLQQSFEQKTKLSWADDVKPALGPELDLVVLPAAANGKPELVGLAQPADGASSTRCSRSSARARGRRSSRRRPAAGRRSRQRSRRSTPSPARPRISRTTTRTRTRPRSCPATRSRACTRTGPRRNSWPARCPGRAR